MIGVALSIIVPVVIYFGLPRMMVKLGYQSGPSKILLVAGLLYFASFYLPSPHVGGYDIKFTTHFVGGGLFSGFLWLYLKRSLKSKMPIWLELASLYFLVSGLGVANELFEFFMDQVGVASIESWDTWWDFLANTSGVLLFWTGYRIYYRRARNKS